MCVIHTYTHMCHSHIHIYTYKHTYTQDVCTYTCMPKPPHTHTDCKVSMTHVFALVQIHVCEHAHVQGRGCEHGWEAEAGTAGPHLAVEAKAA